MYFSYNDFKSLGKDIYYTYVLVGYTVKRVLEYCSIIVIFTCYRMYRI